MSKPHDRIVYCEDDLVMTCDTHTGIHSVYRATGIQPEDLRSYESTMINAPASNKRLETPVRSVPMLLMLTDPITRRLTERGVHICPETFLFCFACAKLALA